MVRYELCCFSFCFYHIWCGIHLGFIFCFLTMRQGHLMIFNAICVLTYIHQCFSGCKGPKNINVVHSVDECHNKPLQSCSTFMTRKHYDFRTLYNETEEVYCFHLFLFEMQNNNALMHVFSVLKRAATIKRRGVDDVRRAPDEPYADISSVGECLGCEGSIPAFFFSLQLGQIA